MMSELWEVCQCIGWRVDSNVNICVHRYFVRACPAPLKLKRSRVYFLVKLVKLL